MKRVRLYEALLKEVKHMVETGQSVAPDQRYRIVYFGIAHTYGHPEMARILRDAGAEIVASVYTFGTCRQFQGNCKWKVVMGSPRPCMGRRTRFVHQKKGHN